MLNCLDASVSKYYHSDTNMKPSAATLDLDTTRLRIVRKLREVRIARGWTQAELAERLGLSQARLSVIERGGGTISAEQFVVLLAITNLPIDEFLPRQDPEDEIQNALARLGALHLRELDDVVPTERFQRVEDAVAETLASPRSSRFILALGPVVTWNADHINLDAVNERLSRLGLSRRLGWLVDALDEGLPLADIAKGSEWWRRVRRTKVVLADYRRRPGAFGPPLDSPPATPSDHLDPQIRSIKTLDIVWQNSGPVARRWGIATEIGPADFAGALAEAAGHG